MTNDDIVEINRLFKILANSPTLFVKNLKNKSIEFLENMRNTALATEWQDELYKRELKEFGRTLINIIIAQREAHETKGRLITYRNK